CIGSFPHCQFPIKIRRKENTFRIGVEQDLLRVKAMPAGTIRSRHRVSVVATLTKFAERYPAMPNPSRFVSQEVETVRQERVHQIIRSVEQQRDALRVLGMNGEVEGLLVLHPRDT